MRGMGWGSIAFVRGSSLRLRERSREGKDHAMAYDVHATTTSRNMPASMW